MNTQISFGLPPEIAFGLLGLLFGMIIGCVGYSSFDKWSRQHKLRQHMTNFSASFDSGVAGFDTAQWLGFLRRSGINLATKVSANIYQFLRVKTYQEWVEYFAQNNFQPKNIRESPIFTKVMLALYAGMVLEAKEAAGDWATLPREQRQWYKQTALSFLHREQMVWTTGDYLYCAYTSALMVHNFFADFKRRDELLDEFVAIVTAAVASEATTIRLTPQEEEEWKEQEKFYDMLIEQVDEDLNRNYSQQELEALERVQHRLYNNEATDSA